MLDSGDPRATVHDKNVTTCAGAGLPGNTIEPADIKAEADKVYIDVLDHAGITAVVVKGGSQYNVYLAKDLAGGWTDLHSPLNASGKPADISHWFACGGPDTEQPPKEQPPNEEQPTSTVTSPPSSTSSAAPATTVTTSAPAAAGAAELASTGFGSAWLVGLGAALLAAGAAVLLVLRRRRA